MTAKLSIASSNVNGTRECVSNSIQEFITNILRLLPPEEACDPESLSEKFQDYLDLSSQKALLAREQQTIRTRMRTYEAELIPYLLKDPSRSLQLSDGKLSAVTRKTRERLNLRNAQSLLTAFLRDTCKWEEHAAANTAAEAVRFIQNSLPQKEHVQLGRVYSKKRVRSEMMK